MTTVRVAVGVAAGLLVQARHAAGLSQGELARRAHTSRPTLSAYEYGRKSPTLATTERLLAEAGYQLSAEPRITFTDHLDRRGRAHAVPDRRNAANTGPLQRHRHPSANFRHRSSPGI